MKTVVIRKMFFAWNMDKEKLFLEQKAKEGLLLLKVGFGKYVFKETKPLDMVYQFDFRLLHKKEEEEYISIFRDWEFVQRTGGWYYFRKIRDGGVDKVFSDVSSVRSMYRRLLGFLALIGFPLYYQLLILFPRVTESGVGSFYKFFIPMVSMISLLHIYSIVRLLITLKKINNLIE